jgi:hypothetical protein
MKRVGAADRVRAAVGHHVGDPVRGVGGHVRDQRGPLGAEGVEEPSQGGRVATRRGPDQVAGVVVDHHGQILVVAFVGNRVDADPAQVRQPVHGLLRVVPHPGHDRADGAPRDPHQLAHRGFRASHR